MFLMKPLILVDRGSSQGGEFFEKKLWGVFQHFPTFLFLKTEKTGKVFLKIKDVKTVLPDRISVQLQSNEKKVRLTLDLRCC